MATPVTYYAIPQFEEFAPDGTPPSKYLYRRGSVLNYPSGNGSSYWIRVTTTLHNSAWPWICLDKNFTSSDNKNGVATSTLEGLGVARVNSNNTKTAHSGGYTVSAVSGYSYQHKVQSNNASYGKIKQGSSSASMKYTEVLFLDDGYSSASELVVSAIPVSSSYVFTGWSGDTQYATINGNTCTIPAEVERDVTITANFAKKVTITLSYNANGGTNAPASQSKSTGQGSSVEFTLAAAPTPPQGYSFTGWQIGSATYAVGASVSISANTSAVAQYAVIPAHTVSFSTSPADIGTPATIVTTPTRTESGVDYYADTADVTIQPLAINGYRLDSVVFYDAANPEVSVGGKTIVDGDLSTFTLPASSRRSRDMLLKFVYAQLEYSVGASVDEASEEKVTASVDQNTAHWGDSVIFEATDIGEGYSFAGWFDADGNLVSSEATYTHEVSGDVTLYAKCKVQCSLSLQYDAEEGDDTTSCSLTVDGAVYVPSTQFAVTLGESFAYVLSLGLRTQDENWCLDRWTNSGGVLQMYGEQGTVTPTAPLALVAHLVSVEDSTKTLVVNTGALPGPPFTHAAPYRRTGSEGSYEWEPTDPYTFEGNIPPATAQHGGPSLMDTPPPGQFSHDFGGGAQYVRISAEPQVWYEDAESETGYSEQSFRGFYDNDGTPISEEASCYLLMAEDREILAVYGDAAPVSLKILYADADSANRGNIAIVALTDAEGSIDEDGQGATITQGYVATLRAVPKNGYDFVGWYDNDFTAGDAISTDKEFEYTVMSAKTVYAKFAPARDKICLWEGSADNMTMEWTSKVYVAPKPFDPVAARVDATGYPVQLDVGTMSSPNAKPTRPHPIEVASQDGRRLPRMRPERFVRFTVKASCEIDAVVIGTNMAEVN